MVPAVSCDPFCVLLDEVHDHVALVRMLGKRPPRVGIEWDLGAGTHALSIRIDGQIVVHVTGASLENAARKGLEAFREWNDDSESGITNALERSLQLPANTNEKRV